MNLLPSTMDVKKGREVEALDAAYRKVFQAVHSGGLSEAEQARFEARLEGLQFAWELFGEPGRRPAPEPLRKAERREAREKLLASAKLALEVCRFGVGAMKAKAALESAVVAAETTGAVE